MKKYIKITFCALLILHFHGSCAMLTRVGQTARQRLSAQQLAAKRALLQTQTRFMTQPIKTAPLAKASPAPISSTGFFARIQNIISSNWGAFKNWWTFKAPTPAPSPVPPTSFKSKLPVIPQPLSMPVPKELMEQPVSLPVSSIDTATNLTQAKNLVTTLEKTEQSKQKDLLNFSTPQWHDLLQKTQRNIAWMHDNCFKTQNPEASQDKDIPTNKYDRILYFLNKANINPASINIRYQDTTHYDPFGHKAISTIGPNLQYSMTDKNIISGFAPATLLLHRQVVEALSPEVFDAELQHAITHLTQGHNEQLKILQDAIGKEKYEQYLKSPEGQKYLSAMETTADFLQPIENEEIAKTVYKAFFEKAFESALDAIKKNREQHGLENKETGLMVCTPPGVQELEFLSELQSFDDIEEYFIKERHKILSSAGLTDDEIKKIETDRAKSKEYIFENCYKDPIPNIKHDQTLAPEILAEVKRLLTQAGINPLSVEIINQTKEQMNGLFAWARCAPTKGSAAQLCFCQEEIATTSIEYTRFAIAHEIAHLIRNHSNDPAIRYTALRKLFFKKKGLDDLGRFKIGDPLKNKLESFLQDLEEQLDTLQELEADTTYLMKDVNIAKIAQHYALNQVQSGQSTNEPDGIYQSENNLFHWITKILQLHTKEKALKNKTSSSSTAKE